MGLSLGFCLGLRDSVLGFGSQGLRKAAPRSPAAGTDQLILQKPRGLVDVGFRVEGLGFRVVGFRLEG